MRNFEALESLRQSIQWNFRESGVLWSGLVLELKKKWDFWAFDRVAIALGSRGERERDFYGGG